MVMHCSCSPLDKNEIVFQERNLFADGSVEDKAEDAAEGSESYLETLHFFGVFDGHGGAEAALHCAQTLHQRIAEALAATIDPEADESLQQDGECQPFPSLCGISFGTDLSRSQTLHLQR